MVEGEEIPPYRVVVNAQAMKSFALLMRNGNPIHLDPEVTAALGYGHRVMNPGPLNHAYIWEMLESWLGSVAHVRRLQTRFVGNAFDGDTVVAGGRVETVDDASRTATCAVWLRRGDEDIVRGLATVSRD